MAQFYVSEPPARISIGTDPGCASRLKFAIIRIVSVARASSQRSGSDKTEVLR